MPIVKSSYRPSPLFRSYHVSTVYASTLRKVEIVQERERLELADYDFIDLDWTYSKTTKSNKVLIVMHGLEGNAQRPYMLGMAKHFSENGWDVAAVNFRGCSGELNRQFRSYHAGATGDLEQVVAHILSGGAYEILALQGFSLGANLMLKYLGEGREIPQQIKAAVMVSAPIDLHGALQKLEERQNYLYAQRFMYKLKDHLYARADKFEKITRQEVDACKTLLEIDDLYTSKAHDFDSALDYYEKNGARQFLENIRIPTLLLSARNDGFLSEACYPVEIAEKSENLYLEMPEYGGHVAFLQSKHTSYSEERSLDFLQSFL